jgi:very-long-chain enoyl-CoA reductase
LTDDQELASVLGKKFDESELQVKDLGPQIGWRTVFLIEYVR